MKSFNLLSFAALAVVVVSASSAFAEVPSEKERGPRAERPPPNGVRPDRPQRGDSERSGENRKQKHEHEHGPRHKDEGRPDARPPRKPGAERRATEGDGPRRDSPERIRLKLKERGEKLKELESKEKEDSLTEEDSARLARLRRARERHQSLEKKSETRREDRPERAQKARDRLAKKHPKRDKDFLGEQRKHSVRAAKLERLLELAEAEERTELIERVKKLQAQEQARHERKLRSQNKRVVPPTEDSTSN